MGGCPRCKSLYVVQVWSNRRADVYGCSTCGHGWEVSRLPLRKFPPGGALARRPVRERVARTLPRWSLGG
jgi:transposase-like protein